MIFREAVLKTKKDAFNFVMCAKNCRSELAIARATGESNKFRGDFWRVAFTWLNRDY